MNETSPTPGSCDPTTCAESSKSNPPSPGEELSPPGQDCACGGSSKCDRQSRSPPHPSPGEEPSPPGQDCACGGSSKSDRRSAPPVVEQVSWVRGGSRSEPGVGLATLGCRLNDAELARWRRELLAAGHRLAASAADADVLVVNTCAVTAEAARKSRQLVRRLHRENPAARIVATGCFAELEPERAAALPGVARVVPNRDKDSLVAQLEAVLARDRPGAITGPEEAPAAARLAARAPRHTRAFVKVQDGCRNQCAFCIVTVARGEERSWTVDEVIDEIAALRADGIQEVVLTGVHLGGYGRDLGSSLRELVGAVLERTDVPRVRLGSLEPWDLGADFFEPWRDPRLCRHLHLPLQSGSDTVLARMARRCTTASYRALVERARAAIPDLVLSTDLIVGYPGESESEAAETLAFLAELGFAHVHTFTYSARPGTRAATLPGRVPAALQRERSRRVHQLAATMKHEILTRAVGDTRDVLWEQDRESAGDSQVRIAGYTDTFLRVEAVVPEDVELTNCITRTRLTGVGAGVLVGEIVDDTVK